ncbi:MAG: hypothetical protein PVH26_08105 [Desulfosarcina sp.]
MVTIRRFVTSLSTSSASIMLAFVFIGLLLGCSGDVSGPEINVSGGAVVDALTPRNIDFTAQKTVHTEIPVTKHSSVSIKAINGKVAVTGHHDVNTIIVTAYLTVGSDSQADADSHLDDLSIEVTETVEVISLQTRQPQTTDGRHYQVEYAISVPSDIAVAANQVNGNIDVEDIHNSVNVVGVNGDIQVDNIVGGVVADVVNGSIEASATLPTQATIDLITNNGRIDLHIPRSTSAVVGATVVSGTIQTTNLRFDDLVQTNQSLTGTLGGGEGIIELWADNGDIRMKGID